MVVKNKTLTFILTVFLMVISFVLYQYFFSGFTKLHNPAKSSNVTISQVQVESNQLKFQGYNKGGETGYIVKLSINDGNNEIVLTANELGKYNKEQITNLTINKVKGNEFALVFPRGAKADINYPLPDGFNGNKLQLTMTDVSGKLFKYPTK